NPPQGVTSPRAGLYAAIASIDTPDSQTVVFKLSRPNPAMMLNFADPFGCVYSAAALAKDPKYPEKAPMGTGPFKFVEYVPGSSVTLTRFDNYFNAPMPYLDGIKEIFLPGPGYVNSIASRQVDAVFCCLAPSGVNQIKQTRSDVVFQQG